jgi:serine/threonine protein kinase
MPALHLAGYSDTHMFRMKHDVICNLCCDVVKIICRLCQFVILGLSTLPVTWHWLQSAKRMCFCSCCAGAAVDWWALGVCLFEFMAGIPPFNDGTPQDVFNNILNRGNGVQYCMMVILIYCMGLQVACVSDLYMVMLPSLVHPSSLVSWEVPHKCELFMQTCWHEAALVETIVIRCLNPNKNYDFPLLWSAQLQIKNVHNQICRTQGDAHFCRPWAILGTTVTDIPWPQKEEQFSEAAHSAIDTLLTLDPILRPAAPQVKQMPLFSAIDWNNLLSTAAPFVPQPDDSTDTVYFQGIWFWRFMAKLHICT